MKFLFQLIFFIVAVLLTFVSIFVVVALIVDSEPQGLLGLSPMNNYTEEDWMVILGTFIVSSSFAVVIYFMLWKTNFFTRNK